MLYGRLWYVSRGDYWSVRFKSKKVFDEALRQLNDTKQAHSDLYIWKRWHLESATKLSDFPKEHWEFVKKSKVISTGLELVEYIHSILDFWERHVEFKYERG